MKSFLFRVFHLFIEFLGVLFHKYARDKTNSEFTENCYKEEENDGECENNKAK